MKFRQTFYFLFITYFGFSQQTEYVDFKKIETDIVFDVSQKKVFGEFECAFEILKDVDSIFVNANKMEFSNIVIHRLGVHVDVEYVNIKFHNDSNRLIIYNEFKKNESYELKFNYSAQPQKAMYFIDWTDPSTSSGQVWTQGQGKYTSNWLPSIDDMNDKIEFDLNITFDKGYEVIANGKLVNKQINEFTITWHYDMQQPMSSYLVALAIGKYNKKVEYSKSGIPLEMYYYPEDSAKFEPTYRYTKQMFDFLEDEIGVPYPWQNYKQVPVKDFLYAGMENTSTTIFSDAFVIDSIAFVDKNYINVNAHELAHQWFGDLVTETSGTHHWLQEGFATYYALLAEKEVFGDDYYYWQLYEYAQELLEQDKVGGNTSLLDPKSSSTTFYKKGAWVLHMLREKVGEEAFKKGVKNYLINNQFKNVATDDFISEIEKTSGQDLSGFVEKWLNSSELNYNELFSSVIINSEVIKIKDLDELETQLILTEKKGMYHSTQYRDLPVLKAYIKSSKPDNLKLNYDGGKPNDFYKSILSSSSIKIRQASAKALSKIPPALKTEYESLLNDKSYVTIEVALFNLWNNFPEEQSKFLNKTKGIVGFNDKNIRILWLTLALLTDDFEPENNEQYFKELNDYTSPKYDFSIRQNAFQYLLWISACSDDCKENLKQATKHHNWQFSKYAKEMLKNR